MKKCAYVKLQSDMKTSCTDNKDKIYNSNCIRFCPVALVRPRQNQQDSVFVP